MQFVGNDSGLYIPQLGFSGGGAYWFIPQPFIQSVEISEFNTEYTRFVVEGVAPDGVHTVEDVLSGRDKTVCELLEQVHAVIKERKKR